MNNEREPQEYNLLIDDVFAMNSYIARRKYDNAPKSEIKSLYEEKNSMIISLLKERAKGDPDIKVAMLKGPNEKIHQLSRTGISIEIPRLHKNIPTSLNVLGQSSGLGAKGVNAVIGTADETTEENVNSYLVRTHQEIRDSERSFKHKILDGTLAEKDEKQLKQVKFKLVRRVFSLRKREDIKIPLEVVLLQRRDAIQINFGNNDNTRIKLHSWVKDLVDETGGYDLVLPRRSDTPSI